MNLRAVAALILIALPFSGSIRRGPDARAELETLERQWLASEHDRGVLERVLADDFLHPVSAGVFLTKRQHIDWAVAHPAPRGRRERFDQLQIRVYDNVGIATGIVVSTDANGPDSRSIFTDVFVRRNGQWQAVNAQENPVEPPAK